MAGSFHLSECFVSQILGQLLGRWESLSSGSSFAGILYSLAISLGLEVRKKTGESSGWEAISLRRNKGK